MYRSFIIAAAAGIVSLGFVDFSHAEGGFIDDGVGAAGQSYAGAGGNAADERLMIVNGNSGHVIYDNGRPDLYCVTRVVVRGYTWAGYPIYGRNMRCR